MKRLKVLTLPWDDDAEQVDDRELVQFLEDPERPRELREHWHHLVVREGRPCVVMVLSYRDLGQRPSQSSRQKERRDWKAELPAADGELYEALRGWRRKSAQEHGVPPYVVFNNRQLAGIASGRPVTLAALGEVSGIGDSKVKRWGEAVVALVEAWGGHGDGSGQDSGAAVGAGAAGALGESAGGAAGQDGEVPAASSADVDQPG